MEKKLNSKGRIIIQKLNTKKRCNHSVGNEQIRMNLPNV